MKVALLNPPWSFEGNIAEVDEVTVKEIAQMILRQTRSRSRLTFRPLPQDDPRRRRPEISAATNTLGWRPRIALEDGLRATIDYFALKVSTPASAEAHEIRIAARQPRKRRTDLSAIGGPA